MEVIPFHVTMNYVTMLLKGNERIFEELEMIRNVLKFYWSIVQLDKKKGGLRIKNLHPLNKALVSKQSWRFTTKQESLWKQPMV